MALQQYLRWFQPESLISSSTNKSLSPIDHAQEMFDASGMEVVQTLNSDNNTVLYGYYDCAKPPHLGFQFPSCSNRTEAQDQNSDIISQEGKIFDVAPHGLELNSTGTRCQSTIVGVKGMTVWLVGQGKRKPLKSELYTPCSPMDSIHAGEIHRPQQGRRNHGVRGIEIKALPQLFNTDWKRIRLNTILR